jgi:hypothetical protein
VSPVCARRKKIIFSCPDPYLIYIQKPNGKKPPKGLDKQGKQASGQNYQIDLLPTSSAKLTTLMAFFCQAGIP